MAGTVPKLVQVFYELAYVQNVIHIFWDGSSKVFHDRVQFGGHTIPNPQSRWREKLAYKLMHVHYRVVDWPEPSGRPHPFVNFLN